MIEFLFLSIADSSAYDDLATISAFHGDSEGFSHWAFKLPLTIYPAALSERHVFRDGRVHIQNVAQPKLEQNWQYFVMTRTDGSRLYCTSYVFYEKKTLKCETPILFGLRGSQIIERQFYLPKCLIFHSKKPYFKLQTNLVKIYREIRGRNPIFCHQHPQKLQLTIENQEENLYKSRRVIPTAPRQNVAASMIMDRLSTHSAPKHLTSEEILKFYVEQSNQASYGEKKIICPRHKIELLHLYNVSESLYRFTYFLHVPVSMENLLTILSALLQEKQVIITSSNQNLNLMLMQTLLELLRPLRWEYMYVPSLPESMLDAAEECFMPYFVGIHRQFLDRITPSGRVILDIENDSIESDENLLALPENLKRIFTRQTAGPNNLSYIEWQKQLRVKSIIFMSDLLAQSYHMDRVALNPNDYKFYGDFFQSSALFHNYKDTMYMQMNVEMNELLWAPFDERVNKIENRFRQLLLQAAFPALSQNDLSWARYSMQKQMAKRPTLNIRDSIISRSTEALKMLKSERTMSTANVSQAFSGRHLKDKQPKRNRIPKKGITFIRSSVLI